MDNINITLQIKLHPTASTNSQLGLEYYYMNPISVGIQATLVVGSYW